MKTPGNMVATWIPCHGENLKRVRHDSIGPFKVRETDPISGIDWHLKVFSGGIECSPYDSNTGMYHHSACATFKFHAPRNIINPLPGSLKTEVDRRPTLVGCASGFRANLERGYAVVASCGAGTLHVSWDYPEYEHPKV